jgi:hypothetical protein
MQQHVGVHCAATDADASMIYNRAVAALLQPEVGSSQYQCLLTRSRSFQCLSKW